MTKQLDGNAYWSAAWLTACERFTDEKSLKRAANQVKKAGFRAGLSDEGIRYIFRKTRGNSHYGRILSSRDPSDTAWQWFFDDLAARPDLVASIQCGELPVEVDELLKQ